MILLWGLSGDGPMDAVHGELLRRKIPLLFVDQRQVMDITVALTVDGGVDGALQVGAAHTQLSDVHAVYLRPYDSRRLPLVEAAGSASLGWRHAISVDDALLCWAEICEALVVNRPGSMAANGSKPYQISQIAGAGFAVPDTLITTDSMSVLKFWQTHGSIVYKSISGIRSIVTRLEPAHMSRIADVSFCPTQFQAYVAGAEYRIHVVGDDIFTCSVQSSADDYRYPTAADEPVDIRSTTLPEETNAKVWDLVHGMGLQVAGVDLRRDADERWYCFEVNPSPAFNYYEAITGQPLTAAVADLLARG
jgi:glutathione synthase/RimK-type ligase-like ATP-grasp enzyme